MPVYTESNPPTAECDAVIIGSGFGGAMAAHELLRAGARVVMVERGDWVRRGPHNWASGAVGTLTPHYCLATPYRVLEGRRGSGDGGPSTAWAGLRLLRRRVLALPRL